MLRPRAQLLPTASLPRLVAIATLLASLVSATLGVAATRAVGGSEYVRLTNDYRASVGLAPVSFHAAVDQITVERANDMARKGKMEHDLEYVTDRLAEMGVCWSNVGEIIAWESGYPSQSYERTMNRWWNSSGHHAIIVGNFNAASGSWTTSAAGTYSVMVFIKTCGSTSTVTRPAPTAIGRAVLTAGTHTGVRFDDGTVVARKTVTLSRTSGAPVLDREKIGGRTYLLIGDGIWKGYWVPETPWSYLPGYFDRVNYDGLQRLVIDPGKYTASKFHSSGLRYDRVSAWVPTRSGADAAAHAIINGRPHFYVVSGVFAGYWLPDVATVWPKR